MQHIINLCFNKCVFNCFPNTYIIIIPNTIIIKLLVISTIIRLLHHKSKECEMVS